MIMCGYKENFEARSSALKLLAKFKKLEKKKGMYTWKKNKGSLLIVAHTKLSRLKEIVNQLGYEWSDGTAMGKDGKR